MTNLKILKKIENKYWSCSSGSCTWWFLANNLYGIIFRVHIFEEFILVWEKLSFEISYCVPRLTNVGAYTTFCRTVSIAQWRQCGVGCRRLEALCRAVAYAQMIQHGWYGSVLHHLPRLAVLGGNIISRCRWSSAPSTYLGVLSACSTAWKTRRVSVRVWLCVLLLLLRAHGSLLDTAPFLAKRNDTSGKVSLTSEGSQWNQSKDDYMGQQQDQIFQDQIAFLVKLEKYTLQNFYEGLK